MSTGIYLIRNKITNKIYIGSAVNISSRWTRHRVQLNKNKHVNNYLQHSWNKYGAENFEFKILQQIDDRKLLIYYEQQWLDKLRPFDIERGYNICSIADSQLGLKRTEEAKLKMSRKGSKHSKETKIKMSLDRKGKKVHTENSKQRIGLFHKGKIVSEETRKKQSNSKKKDNEFRKNNEMILIGNPVVMGE